MYKDIIDISNIIELQPAKYLNTYDILINFFKDKEDFLNKNKIHSHRHHIIPRSEGGSDLKENIVRLPYRYHIKAHWLRGKEFEAQNNLFFAYKNYKAVQYAIRDSSIPKSIQDLELKLDFVIESMKKKKELLHSFIWISKETDCIQIYKQDFEKYQKEGWERRRIFKNPSGKIWTTDGTKNMYCKKEELEKFLKENPTFKKGFIAKITKSQASYSTLNTKWMNKNGISKAIKLEDVESKLKEGWILGHTNKTCNGKHWKKPNYHWFNNGKEQTQALECPSGFIPGRLGSPNKGIKHKDSGKAHWYTNGKENILREFCPEGFYRGRTI